MSCRGQAGERAALGIRIQDRARARGLARLMEEGEEVERRVPALNSPGITIGSPEAPSTTMPESDWPPCAKAANADTHTNAAAASGRRTPPILPPLVIDTDCLVVNPRTGEPNE